MARSTALPPGCASFAAASAAERTTNLSPWNFCGQWHCSQVWEAGRRCFTGDGIGVL